MSMSAAERNLFYLTRWKHGICGCSHDLEICKYSSNYITKKEPKFDARLSEFNWHDLGPAFLAITLLHTLNVF